MEYVLLLEKEKKSQEEIIEALKVINKDFIIKQFASLEDLASWSMQLVQKDSKEVFENDSDPKIPLVIVEKEQMGTHFLGLLVKLRALFIRKKFCTESDPTGCVLTCFEDPEFDRSLFENKAITNVIYKPFDKLVLEHHLRFSLPTTTKKSEGAEIYQMETKVTVEMLKEVDLLGFSEWGFITKSYLPIPIGKISKYYGAPFDLGNKQHHVFAQSVNCTKYPNEEAYKVAFQYVGIDANVLSKLRKQLLNADKESISVVYSEKKAAPLKLKMWVMEDEAKDKIKTILKDILPSTQIEEVSKEMVKDFKGFAPSDVVIVDPFGFAGVLKFATPGQLVVISPDKIDDGFLREAHGVKDILTLQADRKFLKIKIEFLMKYNNQMLWEVRNQPQLIQVANLVNVNQVSEVAIVMTYNRAISIGSFRRFYLTTEKDPEPLPFTASCRGVDEAGKEEFKHVFVFFGVTDTYMKRLRLWMRKAYIDENQESS